MSGDSLLLWGQFRRNNVEQINKMALIFCPANMFGCHNGSGAAAGRLFETSWNSVVNYCPSTLEVINDVDPFDQFKRRIEKCDLTTGAFLANLTYVRIENCNAQPSHVVWLMNHAPKVAVVELIDLPHLAQLKLSELDKAFKGCELNALGISQLPMKLVNPLLRHLSISLRLLRLGGSKALTLSEFVKLTVKMVCVEFLILQNIEVESEECMQNFFNGVLEYFPHNKYVYMDWKFICDAVVYDTFTITMIKSICNYYRKGKLIYFAILFYSPDEHVKGEVSKALDLIRDEEQLPCVTYSMSSNADEEAPDNFTLLIIGQQTNKRTKALVQLVVGRKVVNPNAQHFFDTLELVESTALDALVQFAGFDNGRVKEDFENRHADQTLWIDDQLAKRAALKAPMSAML